MKRVEALKKRNEQPKPWTTIAQSIPRILEDVSDSKVVVKESQGTATTPCTRGQKDDHCLFHLDRNEGNAARERNTFLKQRAIQYHTIRSVQLRCEITILFINDRTRTRCRIQSESVQLDQRHGDHDHDHDHETDIDFLT